MTTLEYGKFIKNFVRDSNGKRPPHSNWRGYSKADVEQIIPKIDTTYLDNWSKFLSDKKNDEKLMSNFSDYQHYLFQLNSIEDADIKKYHLPEDFIVL